MSIDKYLSELARSSASGITTELVDAQPSTKSSLLQSKTQEKLGRLGQYTNPSAESMPLLGTTSGGRFYDADSPYSAGTGIETDQNTMRIGYPSSSTAAYVNAPEKKFKDREPTSADLARYNASMIVKDNFAMGTTASTPAEIQDLITNPMTPENQALYNTTMKQTYDEGQGGGIELRGQEGKVDIHGRSVVQAYQPDAPVPGESLEERLLKTGTAEMYSYGKPAPQQQAPEVTQEGLTSSLMSTLKQRESKGDYKVENAYGYIGAYQFGAARLADLGLVKPGTTNKQLNDPAVWTGKHGVDSKTTFLSNPEIQDKVAREHITDYVTRLAPQSTDARDLAGKVAAAHLLGVKGAKDLNAMDANETTGLEYYNLGASAIEGVQASPQQSTRDRILAELAAEKADKGYLEQILSLPQAIMSGMGKSAYDVADTYTELAGDVVGRAVGVVDEGVGVKIDKTVDLGTDEEKRTLVNNLLAYDDTFTQANIKKVTSLYDEAMKEVSFWSPSTWDNVEVSKLGDAAATAFEDIETAGYSFGYMGIALYGAAGKVATKAIGGAVAEHTEGVVNTLAKVAKGEITKKAAQEAAVKSLGDLSKTDRVKLFMVNNADALNYGAMMNNDQMDEFIANNGGEDATLFRALVGTAANALGMKLDVGVMNSVLKPSKGTAEVVSNWIKGMEPGAAKAFIGNMVSLSIKAGSAGIKELPQEWTQTFIEEFNKVYGTKVEGKEIGVKQASDISRDAAGVGALMGLAGAAQTSVATQTLGTLAGGPGLDKLKAEMERRKEAKKTPEQKKADVIFKEEKVATGSIIDSYMKESDELTEKGDITSSTHALIQAYKALDTMPESEEKTTYENELLNRRYALAAKRSKEYEDVITDKNVESIKMLGSSEDQMRALRRILESMDSDEKVDNATEDEALNELATALDLNTEEVKTIKNEVKEERVELDKIRKSLSQVEGDVVTGPRGYMTYYSALKDAKAVGDTKAIEDFTDKLGMFRDSQADKLRKLETGVKEIEADLRGRIAREAKDTGVSEDAVVQEFLKAKLGTKDIEYSETDRAFEVNLKNVLQSMMDENARTGPYSVMDAIKGSIDAMDKLVPSIQPKTKTFKRKVEAQDETISLDRQDIDTLSVNEITRELKELDKTETRRSLTTDEVVKYGELKSRQNELQAQVNEGKVDEQQQPTTEAKEEDEKPTPPKKPKEPSAPTVEETSKSTKEEEVDDKQVETRAPRSAEDVKLEADSYNEQYARMQDEKDVKQQEVAKLKADRKGADKETKEAIKYELDNAYAAMDSIKAEMQILVDNRRELVKDLKTNKAKSLLDNAKQEALAKELLVVKGVPVITEWVTPELKKELDAKTLEVKVALDSTIMQAVATKSKLEEVKTKKDSPFRVLMQGDGKYPVEVAEAMTIAITSYMADRFSELNKNDDIQIRKMLGLKDHVKVPYAVRKAMEGVGRYEFNEAATLGKDILKSLGLEASGTADHTMQARLEADAGATALAVMETMELVKRDATLTRESRARYEYMANNNGSVEGFKYEGIDGDKKVATTIIHPTKGRGKWVAVKNEYKEFSDRLEDELDTGTRVKNPRYSKKKEKTHHVTRNAEKWTELTSNQQTALDTAENRAHEFHTGAVGVLKDMWGEVTKEGELTAKQVEVAELFGWEDPAARHIDMRPNVESKNREIVDSIQSLLDFAEAAGTRDVYFNYFFSKNGRFFMDSTKLNPQTDKLHRFIVNVKEKTSNKIVTDKTRDVFKIAVVQAFDGSKVVKFAETGDGKSETVDGEVIRGLGAIDKQTQESTIEQFEEILKNAIIQKAIKDPSAENMIAAIQGVDHPSHAMMAILEMAKYNADEDFETTMTMETDAVTSGFILGLLANPVISIDKLTKWVAKGGVWLGGSEYKNYGEWKSVRGSKDSYETGADIATKNLSTTLKETPSKQWITQLVGGINRNFMKYPLMVFVYGAGAAGIQRSISSTAADETINKLSDASKIASTLNTLVEGIGNSISDLNTLIKVAEQEKESGRVRALKYVRNKRTAALEVLKTKQRYTMVQKGESQFANEFREVRLNHVYTTRDTMPNTQDKRKMTADEVVRYNKLSKALDVVQDLVIETTKDTYGEATTKFLTEEFKELVESREAINNAFTGMFGAFKSEFDYRLKEVREEAGREVASKDQVDELLEEMMLEGKIPGIMTVEATKAHEKAPVMKTERTRGPEGSEVQIKTKPQRTVHPLVYEMVANPVAGAVTNIHYLDGALIMKLIMDSSGFGVHDAFVAHVNNVVDATRKYNEQTWELTQKFNMVERVQKALEDATANTSVDIVRDAIWDNYVEAFGEPDPMDEESPTRDSMYSSMRTTLKKNIVTIKENKAIMKEMGASINHMAGPEGSIYAVAGVEGDGSVPITKIAVAQQKEASTHGVEAPMVDEVYQLDVKHVQSDVIRKIDTAVESFSMGVYDVIEVAKRRATPSTIKWLSGFKNKIDTFAKLSAATKSKYNDIKMEALGNKKLGKNGKYKYLKNVHAQRERLKSATMEASEIGESEESVQERRRVALKKDVTYDPYEDMNVEDIAELDRIYEEEQAYLKSEADIMIQNREAVVNEFKELNKELVSGMNTTIKNKINEIIAKSKCL